jgi:hypothetical protein
VYQVDDRSSTSSTDRPLGPPIAQTPNALSEKEISDSQSEGVDEVDEVDDLILPFTGDGDEPRERGEM